MEIQDVKKVVEEVIAKALKEYIDPMMVYLEQHRIRLEEKLKQVQI